jgi:hypothetical protein
MDHAMIITPFLTLKLRTKKDVLLARQRARRVASLLAFDPQEQACIAAAVFLVAEQALAQFGSAQLCFQSENNQLLVFAEQTETANPRLQGLLGNEQARMRLVKPLPTRDGPAEEIELGWLVRKLEQTSGESLFAEIARQNQEILVLLHELRLCRTAAEKKEEKVPPPHAA